MTGLEGLGVGPECSRHPLQNIGGGGGPDRPLPPRHVIRTGHQSLVKADKGERRCLKLCRRLNGFNCNFILEKNDGTLFQCGQLAAGGQDLF